MRKQNISLICMLAAAYVATMIFFIALEATATPQDQLVYIAFPPWSAVTDNQRRIVAAGGRLVGVAAWRSVFKVALTDESVLAKLQAGGGILAVSASRWPICSSSIARL